MKDKSRGRALTIPPTTEATLLRFAFTVSSEQAARLRALQEQFAAACNFIAPIVQATRCWHRVALHHLTYKALRQHFPQLGSQMACNAIYSVCRAARIVYQHPQSPWNASRHPTAPLPLLRFLPAAPVYFDRHTLTLKPSGVSLYALDGRMHFELDMAADLLARIRAGQVREIVLLAETANRFVLQFQLGQAASATERTPAAWHALPEYLLVDTAAPEAPESALAPAGNGFSSALMKRVA